MFCPHCKKPIHTEVTDEVIAEAKKLRKEGYSLRDIESILRGKGRIVSFSTLARRLRNNP